MASITAGGTRDSFLKALTHVTGEIVQYATLVRANILEMDLKENEEKYREVAIDKFFYLCFGRHALFFVDRMMKGRDDSEGVLKRVPYVAIQQLRIDPEESCLLCIEFKGEDDGRPRDVPPNVYLHVMCRDEVLTQLQVSWKTDYIMQKFEIKGFPGVVRDHELSNTWSKHWEVRFRRRGGPAEKRKRNLRQRCQTRQSPKRTRGSLALGPIRELMHLSSQRLRTTNSCKLGPTRSSARQSTTRLSLAAQWR